MHSVLPTTPTGISIQKTQSPKEQSGCISLLFQQEKMPADAALSEYNNFPSTSFIISNSAPLPPIENIVTHQPSGVTQFDDISRERSMNCALTASFIVLCNNGSMHCSIRRY